MKRISLLGLLFFTGLAAGPALADQQTDAIPDQARLWLAQMSHEQRERLRERWEQTSPEERAAIRRELRERIQNVPPEEREQLRRRMLEEAPPSPRLEREPRSERWQAAPRESGGFGQGYEHRHERMERQAPDRPARSRHR